MTDDHAAHGNATLSLSEQTPDDGIVHQSWTVCACGAKQLRAMLGEPQHESIATHDQVLATAQAAVDNGLRLGPDFGAGE